MANTGLIVGVDVGGTFTDVFALDTSTGRIATAKVPTTLDDQSRGFVEGIGLAAKSLGALMPAVQTVVHGTTTGTNALLERKGARTGIITTRGFRDVLEMRRRDRPTTWGLKGAFEPVVARTSRVEVDERVLADGTVLQAVDTDQVQQQARLLLAQGCESVCVFFINGHANAQNESAAVAAVRSVWPGSHVTAATEILPEIREFERLSTATLNAYLQPVVSAYLDRLESGLADSGCSTDVLIVQSNGGVMSVDMAKSYPVRTALSGPAAGVIAATRIAQAAGFDNIVTCDMGGTSFDVSLVAAGEASLSPQTAIDFGLVIRTPMIEITTIGAGGGSIGWIDDGGLLQVGPESAGSDPGPVCYGAGNTRPTLTDANVLLGRINPDRPIGGKLTRLDVEAARHAIEAEVARPLKLSVEDAAEAMLTIANAKMAGAIRLVSIEQGHDPAEFVAMPFGGGGALHTGALIKQVGLQGALVPRFPGITSALGCVVADMRHDRVQTVNQLLNAMNVAALDYDMQAVARELEAVLQQSDVTFTGVDKLITLDMLYVGQTHTVSVPLSDITDINREMVQAAFDSAYQNSYGRLLDGIPVRVMNFRVAVVGRRPALDLSVFAPPQDKEPPAGAATLRNVYVDGIWHQAAVHDRLLLPVGAKVVGPALLEQADTTIFIDPGLVGSVDTFGNLLIDKLTAQDENSDDVRKHS